MPVKRRRPIYGENPEQSQLPAGGSMRVPPTQFPKQPAAFYSRLPADRPTLNLDAPPLGYSWEIINLRIPLYLDLLIGLNAEVEPRMEFIEVGLAMYVGSLKLTLLTKRLTLQETVNPVPEGKAKEITGQWNLIFSESPPVPLTIPGGQQLTLKFILLNLRSKASIAAGNNVTMLGGWGEEIVNNLGGIVGLSGNVPAAESIVNYRYS